MKVLHLTLKRKWFDMIASGEKKEEYREIKPYYVNKLFIQETWACPEDWYPEEIANELIKFPMELSNVPKWSTANFRKYDIVKFRNGYRKDSPTIQLEYNGFTVSTGNPEWGAEPGKEYFVIKLGKIIQS